MSHNKDSVKACPNCGYEATYNYCAQCGQETHLHKDTFWGLILHFVSHYFHYDSKFWNTIKTLVAKPGELTLAYRKGQRVRFIPPISLYIFVSTVFFLAYFFFMPQTIQKATKKGSYGDKMTTKIIEHAHAADSTVKTLTEEEKAKNF